jgi:hypothetical protein
MIDSVKKAYLLIFFISRNFAPLRLVEDLNNASNLSALLEKLMASTPWFLSVAKKTTNTTDEYRYVLLLERMKIIKVVTTLSSSIMNTCHQ